LRNDSSIIARCLKYRKFLSRSGIFAFKIVTQKIVAVSATINFLLSRVFIHFIFEDELIRTFSNENYYCNHQIKSVNEQLAVPGNRMYKPVINLRSSKLNKLN